MILRNVSLLTALLASYTLADVAILSPKPGDTITGLSLDIEWEDSGKTPALKDLASFQVFLCAGGNTDANYIQLATLVQAGDFADASTVRVPLTAGWGGDDKNAYFLKFISAAAGGTVINYSDRFTLASMTGTFPASVQAGLRTVTGTAGPVDVNNVQAAAAPPLAVPSAGAAEYNVPYTLQSGSIRYAPMPTKAGTKITAKNPRMQFPTSAYTVYKKVAGPPDAESTLTAPETHTVKSVEPTIPPAAMPADGNAQKFLNRWRD
ncbi:hypothetical protein B0A52_01092 [Exophiala mesophila]|uniref:Uncharacterized protein n=1 Tax=Exophiala mesophila TaxID=212818 RepID=A0A438NGF0_EXOME|nr:hypothetical protein B0A52_01092 [Exophiala mesophila]